MPGRSLIERVAAFSTRHPKGVVGVTLLLALGAAALLPRLQIRGEIDDLLPTRPGPVAELGAFRRLFGGEQELVVLLQGPRPPEVEATARWLGETFERAPWVRRVDAGLSPAALLGLWERAAFALVPEHAFPAVRERLTTGLRAQVKRLRRLLLSPLSANTTALRADPLGLAELLLGEEGRRRGAPGGAYASPDGRALLLFVHPRGATSDATFLRQLDAELTAIAARRPHPEVSLSFTGGYRYAWFLSALVRRDLQVSSVAATLGAVLLILLFFRSARLLPAAAVVSGLAVLGTLAVATLTLGRLNPLTLAFAAICLGLGVDPLLHVVARSRQFAGLPPPDRFAQTVGAVAPALLASNLTTILTFASFAGSSFRGLRHIGLLSACGLLLSLVLTLVVFPALAVLLPPGSGPAGPTALDRVMTWLPAALSRRRRVVLVTALAVVLGAAWIGRGADVRGDLSHLAPAELPPAETDRRIAAAFEQSPHRLVVLLRGRDEARVLEATDRLAARTAELVRSGRVAQVRSLSSWLPAPSTQARRLAALRDLDPPALSRRLHATLADEGLAPEAFAPFLARLADPRAFARSDLQPALDPLLGRHLAREGDETVTATLVHPRPGSDELALARELSAFAADPAVRVTVTGTAPATEEVAALERRDLLLVGGLALVAVLLAVGLLLRRAWPAVAVLLSLGAAVALYAAALVLLELPVDLYTLFVVPVLIGYGVDNNLYLARRTLEAGLTESLATSSRAVLVTTLTSAAGFGALGLCRLPGLRALGLSAVVGLLLSLLGAFVLLPTLLGLGREKPRP